jgi:Zn-dependent peptidase ImmA (M78 family)/transcriptional regulator with XRE-family HTH domain
MINHQLLEWVRVRRGLSIEDVRKKTKFPELEIKRWESGDALPTYDQLDTLAYDVYKVPLAGLFMDSPPEDADAIKKFRAIAGYEDFSPSKYLADVIIKTGFFQSVIAELDGANTCTIVGKLSAKTGIIKASREIRKLLNWDKIEIDTESAEERVEAIRERMGGIGIYVFKEAFHDQEVSGFCLIDDNYPVIAINNSNAFSRQLFTLIHEFAHILINNPGVTNNLRTFNFNEEVFCNKVANAVLIPDESVNSIGFTTLSIEILSELASSFIVSREVVLRKLFDIGKIEHRDFLKYSELLKTDFLRKGKERSGGNYYNTKRVYLGRRYIGIVFRGIDSGAIDGHTASKYLNIKYENLGKFKKVVYG